MPSMFVEIAWSEGLQIESIVPSTKISSVACEENRHPNWNQQIILQNPPSHPEA